MRKVSCRTGVKVGNKHAAAAHKTALQRGAAAQIALALTPFATPFFSTACAQERDFSGYSPVAVAVRIENERKPAIDGDLSDDAWARAQRIEGKFYTNQPVSGLEPEDDTEVYILYDDANIYVAFRARDSHPERIVANTMQRDFETNAEDSIRVFLDPFLTGRDGFVFGLNPAGARLEGLVQNNDEFKPEWDAIWEGAAKITEEGWTAELAIPFRSISYDASARFWGLQLARSQRRLNDTYRWSSIDRSKRLNNLSDIGRLQIEAPDAEGIGLDVQTIATINGSQDWSQAGSSPDVELIPSVNIFYKFTPSLTGVLTVNTDFSDAPLDQRQVNTGRFSLFLPETREFFLQDAAVFEFGGRAFDEDERNGMPFFSRRIGFAGGEPADILLGGKLSGQLGPVSIGALSTRTKSNDNADGQMLSIARASVEVLEESRVGLIVTDGDPLGLVRNTVAGADFQYRNSNLIGEGVVFADLGYLRSWQDGAAKDLFGAELAYEADRWNWTVRLRDIERDFDPRLGFVNRSGVRSAFGDAFRLWRPKGVGVREIETGVSAKAVTGADGSLLDQEIRGRARIEWVTDDELTVSVNAYDINILEPFKVAGIVDVPAGTYRYMQGEIKAESSPVRRISTSMEIKWGRVYDGSYLMLAPSVQLRPSRHIDISLDYDRRVFDLPNGRIAVHVASSELNLSVSPQLQFNALAQYDNISESLALSGRVRWEFDPATEVQFIVRHSAEIDGMMFPQDFISTGSSATVRLSRIFRM